MSYAGNSSHHAEELRESLTEDDVSALRADIEALGIDAWLDWCDANENEALSYLSAAPKARDKKKAWQEPVHRRRLIFFAYRLARMAASLLEGMAYLGPGGGYRETTGAAAHRCLDILREGHWRWPFWGDPPTGWPGPKQRYYQTVTGIPGKKPIIREGYTYD